MVDSVPRILEGRGRLVQNASVAATELIRQAILDGRLEPGSRLKEEELARELGISRTPVREALLMLQAEGLIETTPNRGAVVRTHDADDLIDLYQLRALLEGYAARQAATRISGDELDLLRESCDRFDAHRRRRRPRARQGEPLVPQRDPRCGRKRAAERDGAPGDRAAARLQVVRLVLARPEADLGALPPADHERAERPRRRAGRARDARARLRGARPARRRTSATSAEAPVTEQAIDRTRGRRGGPPGRAARGRPGDRARHAARRAVHRAAARRPRRRDHQGRGSDQARSDPGVGQGALRGTLALVARPVAQQEVRDAEPALGARAGAPARARPRRGRRHGELPARHARALEPRLRADAGGESGDHPRARLRVRPDRPVRRAGGVRVRRRGDGRAPLHQRLSRRAAAAHPHLARRLARRDVRRAGDPRGAVLARRGRQRRRAGRRRLAARGVVRPAREHRARVRPARDRARAGRHRSDRASRRRTSSSRATTSGW